MDFTEKQYDLLLRMIDASIRRAESSGIPIGKEYYEDISIIRDSIYQKIQSC
jgi:hypothetical protein